jgi:polar amino acid transport system permease protein
VIARAATRAAILLGAAALLALALTRIDYPWDWSSALAYRGRLLEGLALTLAISSGALLAGLVLGTLGCLLRLASAEAPRFLGALYVEAVRGTPLLVQLYLAYFCVPRALGVRDPSPALVGVLALGVFSGAYIAEILRAGVLSIDPGQRAAAYALGLTRGQTLVRVIAPQALRRVIPPLAGQLVSLVKDSSLLSVISVVEVTMVAERQAATTARIFESYLPLAGLYLLITFPLSRLSAALERRLAARG